MKDLQSKAMLVSLSLRAWKGTATDRELAAQTEAASQAETGTMRVIKELTPKFYIHPINHIMSVGRSEHYNMTVNGLVRGQQLLSAKLFDRYIAIQREIKEEFWQRVEAFLNAYPSIVETAPKRLKKAFKEADFPTQSQIRTYFSYEMHFSPVPTTGDWRLDGISNSEIKELRGQIEDDVRKMFNAATVQVFEKAREVLEKIADQARSYKGGGPGSAQLRDATIQNLKEVSQLIVQMNVTGDTELQRIGYEMIENFADVEAQLLRSSSEAREKVANAAEAILQRIRK